MKQTSLHQELHQRLCWGIFQIILLIFLDILNRKRSEQRLRLDLDIYPILHRFGDTLLRLMHNPHRHKTNRVLLNRLWQMQGPRIPPDHLHGIKDAYHLFLMHHKTHQNIHGKEGCLTVYELAVYPLIVLYHQNML